MEVTKKFQIPAHEETRVVQVLCDICKCNVKETDFPYEDYHIKILAERGEDFGLHGGSRESVEYDLCWKCFNGALKKFFEDQGIQPRTNKTEW